jgi:DNA-3-methyladenine glycosylase
MPSGLPDRAGRVARPGETRAAEAIAGEGLPRSFFDRQAEEVAPDLLGRVIEHATTRGLVAIRLTEVEAYAGPADPASHAYRGPTRRTEVMFGPPGHVYVYFTYGMHYCMNLVCLPEGAASAVLLRAGRVVEGTGLARGTRVRLAERLLASGPARLCTALAVGPEQNGWDACGPASPLRARTGDPAPRRVIRSGPRTGVAKAATIAWRFWIDGEETVSPYRKHVPRNRQSERGPAADRPPAGGAAAG